MKVAILGDTHHGVKSDSQVMHEHFKTFMHDIFLPTIDKENIKTIIHLGDILDRRKHVNFITLDRLMQDLIVPIQERDVTMHLILGNHDHYYRENNNLSGSKLLLRHINNIRIYDEATEVMVGDRNCLFVPYIFKSNEDLSLQAIKRSEAKYCFGHLELRDFAFSKDVMASDGHVPELFHKFSRVFSGHYHHKSTKHPIYYLGTTLGFTWADYDDPKGFHIFDFNSHELRFIPNNNILFRKVFYDDSPDTGGDLVVPGDLGQRFVKVIVKNKSDPHGFDKFVGEIEAQSPADLQIVDDHLNMDTVQSDDVISQAGDTLSMITQHIESMPLGIDNNALMSEMKSLYWEAMNNK
jgi:DNA repair exonuclease SbcCD nuclease subunit